jgi:Ala-tRNA(Pro) deacylase
VAHAMTVADFLERHHLAHEIVSHAPTGSSSIPPRRLIFRRSELRRRAAECGWEICARRDSRQLPSRLDELRRQLQAKVKLATREDLESVFDDCVLGAVPPLGPAFGIGSIWNEKLTEEPDLYFELGDHTHLVHVRTGTTWRS